MAVGDVNVKRFFGTDDLGSSFATLFTVPASHRYVIRSILVYNQSSADRTWGLTMTGGLELANNWNLSPYQTIQWDTFIVMEAGEVMEAKGSIANVINLTISGWDEEV